MTETKATEPAAGMRDAVGEIGRATAAHAAALARLHASLFADGWNTAAMRALLADSGMLAWVASPPVADAPQAADGTPDVRGLLIARVVLDEAEILTLAVDRAAQRRGIAGQLLTALLAEARARQLQRIFLEVAAGNLPAQRLYRAHGFAEIGRRRGYYAHVGKTPEDALVLALHLDPA